LPNSLPTIGRDEWFERRGRYDRGPDTNARWFAEVALVERALVEFGARGRVLEMAGGTGWWTERLARTANELTVIDASPETIARNRARLLAGGLPLPRYIEADLFAWRPDARYDAVFFGFWLSHVPEERFDSFWETVAYELVPEGRVFFVDSRREPTSTARDHVLGDGDVQPRRLNDGRTYRVVKRFYDSATLTERLIRLGWQAEIATTPQYFVYGGVVPHTGIRHDRP
jgi:demethylmenaquinone methyltransferase/2-methoxy-6-polyprenyl-1,4-benzoquinol methylase